MIHAQNTKGKVLMALTDGAAVTTTGYVDTRGWDYLTVDVGLDSAAATSNIMRACFLSHSDTTSFGATDKIVAFTGATATSTSAGFTFPTAADTANQTLIRMFMDLKARKRYVELSVTGPTADLIVYGHATLSRGKESPNTVTEAGAVGWARG